MCKPDTPVGEIKWVQFKRISSTAATVYIDSRLAVSQWIYHYLHWTHAQKIFNNGVLRVAAPSKWKDPYERWWCDQLFTTSIGRLARAGALASCWTTTYDQETYWRLYDHGGSRTVVRLRTTVAKMLELLSSAVAITPAKAFIGIVRYHKPHELKRQAALLKSGHLKEVAAEAARMLHMKRLAFEYEREVRIVWVEKPIDDVVERYLPIVDIAMFDQVMIGPASKNRTVKSVTSKLKSFSLLNVLQSSFYQEPTE